jgi:probable selenium-dependent hydroxylase accessory protein YqeC
VARGDIVSFVGAGGKTTSLVRTAREQADIGLRVILTTTTRILVPGPLECDTLLVAADQGHLLEQLGPAFGKHRRIAVGSAVSPEGKLLGLDPRLVRRLSRAGDVLLVEADGARGKSLKAPAPYEPVIPIATTLCVIVVGADAIGKPLSEEWVHRPFEVARVAGLREGDPMDWGTLHRILYSPSGYAAKVPRRARAVLLVNKVSPDDCGKVVEGLRSMDWPRLEAVVLGAAAAVDPEARFVRWGLS